MAHPPLHTYMGIPPPPLPEFHQHNEALSVASRTEEGSARESPPTLDGTADERWQYRKATALTKTFKAPQPSDEVPPLAVYHICRICLRPRSARYHQEHPIPIDGVPPPPGICRRCRVVSVDDTKTIAQVFEQSESKDVKLGVKCLVPDMDYFTNDEMRSRRAGHILEQVERFSLEPATKQPDSRNSRPKAKEEIIYRHVHIAMPPPPLPPPCPPPLHPPTIPVAFAEQTSRSVMESARSNSSRHTLPKDTQYVRSMPIPPPSSPPVLAAAAERRMSTPKPPVQANSATSHRSKHTSLRRTSISKVERSGPTESEIRRLAREEVVRYRQAERKVEAHKEPYAHGRLVPMEQERIPVERRIELQADVAETMPWHQSAAVQTRRDSAFALPTRSHKEEEQNVNDGVYVAYISQRVHDKTWEGSTEPPSSLSSDKTRWPGAETKRTYSVSERVQNEKNARDELAEYRPDRETRYYKVTQEKPDSPKRQEEAAHRQYRVEAVTAAAENPPASVRSSRRTDHEYRDDGETAWRLEQAPTERKEERIVQTADGQDVAPQKGNVRQTASRRGPRSDRYLADLPYPQEDYAAPLSMPSPSSHASGRKSSAKFDDRDKEYFYMERTVEPIGRASRKALEQSPGTYYRETEEYLHRCKPPQDHSKPSQPVPRSEAKERRPSDVSSRVRFSNKLDISPTPPGSDASSSQFRNFGGKTKVEADGWGPESGANLIAEYEHRGRQRSRTPSRVDGFYYERDVVQSRERGFRPAGRNEGDRTPRTGTYAPSETATGLSTMPSNIRPIARALSESPSREKLRAAAMRHKSDGLPPYVVPESPDASVAVEDGSTLTTDSSGSYARREVEVRHKGRERQRKR